MMKQHKSLLLQDGGSRRSNPAFFSGLPRSLCSLAMTLMMLMCLFSLPVRAAADITTGLVGYWRLDETSGTTAIDATGNNDLTYSNSADPSTDSVAGKLGTAIDLDLSKVTNGNVSVDGDISPITATHDLTVSAWIYYKGNPDTDGAVSVIDLPGYFTLRKANIDPRLQFATVAWDTTNDVEWFGTIVPDTWMHVAVTYSYDDPVNTPPQTYINGVPLPLTSFSTAGSFSAPVDNRIVIGKRYDSSSSTFPGIIDDVRIYDRVLTREDVTELYRSWDGNIDYNTDARVPEYYNGDQWVTMGPSPYVPNAVEFDGSTYLTYGSEYTGVTDGKTVSASFWTRFNTYPTSTTYTVLSGNPSRFRIYYAGGGTQTMQMLLQDASGTTLANIGCGPDPHEVGVWYHHLISVDVGTGVARCYVDDADSIQTFTAPTDGMIDFTTANNSVGANTTSSLAMDGQIADLWVDIGTYLDFSVASNRRKFIDAAGNPVYLGPNGSIPTGSAPDIFFSGDTATWHLNKGTGGGFTENGALTDALTTSMNVDVTSGLVGHWKLDEGSGTAVADSSGNGNDGSMINGLSGVDSEVGEIGNALHFDGGDDGIEIPNSATLQPANAVTMAAWVKFDSPSNEVIIAKQVGTTPTDYRNSYTIVISNSGTRVTGYVGNSGNLVGVPYDYDFQPDTWYHVAYTFDDPTNATALYIDGQEVASGTTNQSMGYNTSPVTIGFDYEGEAQTSPGYYVDGLIDDVRIYNRALSAAEINALYNKTSVCSGPAGYGGKIIYNADSQVLQYCDGTNWRAMGPYPGAGTGGCANPTRAEGSLIFNEDHSVMQYCDGDEWVSVGSWTPPPCGGIGGTCADGSIYAGLSPDGGVPMFTTPADAPGTYSWSGSSVNTMIDCVTPPPGQQTTCLTGQANTTLLAGLAGTYAAADYCASLTAHGQIDWYLPASDEVFLLYSNKNAGALNGSFNETGAKYHTSSEGSNFFSLSIGFDNGGVGFGSKSNNFIVRCVRKG